MRFVSCDVTGRTAEIRLNRPEKMNAFHAEMLTELSSCLKNMSRNNDVDIVVLRGAGKVFSAGGDMKEIERLTDEAEFCAVMDSVNDIALYFYSMSKLTVAAIHGAAAGLGLSIALAADYVLSETDAKLSMNFINVGLIPDGGGHFMMERRVGPVKAKKVIWEGKTMSGAEAAEMGLVDRSVQPGCLDEELSYLLKELNQKPVEAMIKTKKIMADMHRPQLLKTLELEKNGQIEMRKTAAHQEGLRAFLEKRKPDFSRTE